MSSLSKNGSVLDDKGADSGGLGLAWEALRGCERGHGWLAEVDSASGKQGKAKHERAVRDVGGEVSSMVMRLL